jgi:hypothetical protein
MPPAYVRPYVKRQKNDAADAPTPSRELDLNAGPILALAGERPKRPPAPSAATRIDV